MLIAIAALGIPFDASSLDRAGLGGSESAVIYMARELARLGHTVKVFCLCNAPGLYPYSRRLEDMSIPDVEYIDIRRDGGQVWKDAANGYLPEHDHESKMARHERAERVEWDLVVISRATGLLQTTINAKSIALWCHDMPPVSADDKEAFLASIWQVDRIILLSEFQKREYLKIADCSATAAKLEKLIYVSRNGVDIEAVKENLRPKVAGKLIYASRPERGLIHLLADIFPRLLKWRPDLTLHLASYDVGGIPDQVRAVHEQCNALADKLGDSVVRMGSLNKAQLYQQISSAEAMVYPCDFPEISCIAAMEAVACGTQVITTNAFALPETLSGSPFLVSGIPGKDGHVENFLETVKSALRQADDPANTVKVASWADIAAEWLNDLVLPSHVAIAPETNADPFPHDQRGNAPRKLRSIAIVNWGLAFNGNSVEEGGVGGTETAIICLAKALAARGHQVTVICNCDRPKIYVAEPSHAVLYLHANSLTDVPRFDVMIAAAFQNAAFIQKFPADQKIYWSHGQVWQIGGEKALNSFKNLVQTIVCATRYNENSYHRAGASHTSVINNSINAEFIRQNLRPKVPGKLIYCSRPERGLIHLLRDIFPAMLKENPTLRLHLTTYQPRNLSDAPKTPLYAECDALAAALGDRVVIHGELSKAELYQHISSACAMVYPCDFEESGCVAALEAQACGTPVIATNDFAIPEVTHPLGRVLIDCRDVELRGYHLAEDAKSGVEANAAGFAHYALEVMRRGLTPEVAEQVMQWAAEFDYAKTGEKWEALFAPQLRGEAPLIVGGPRASGIGKGTITLCMIVKDAEDDIFRCIKSVRPYVDQILICDTGSSDSTCDILQGLMEDGESPGVNFSRIHFNNFAQARNESMMGAKGEWILWIDADEVLIGGENLRKYLRGNFHEGFAVQQRHLMADNMPIVDTPVRLFRRNPQYRFTGLVHEHCQDVGADAAHPTFDEPIRPAMALPDVFIAHYGYVQEKVRRQKVENRNLPLLRRSLIEEPGRQLTYVLAMRDLVHLAKWELTEKRSIPAGSPRHKGLMTVAEVFFAERDGIQGKTFNGGFSDESHPYHALAYAQFQEALAVLAACGLPCRGAQPPFQVAYSAMGSTVGLADQQHIKMPRWFVDRQHFADFAADRRDKLLAGMGIKERRSTRSAFVEETDRSSVPNAGDGQNAADQQHAPEAMALAGSLA